MFNNVIIKIYTNYYHAFYLSFSAWAFSFASALFSLTFSFASSSFAYYLSFSVWAFSFVSALFSLAFSFASSSFAYYLSFSVWAFSFASALFSLAFSLASSTASAILFLQSSQDTSTSFSFVNLLYWLTTGLKCKYKVPVNRISDNNIAKLVLMDFIFLLDI